MARDRAEVRAEISAVRALIRHDLDAASARVARRMRVAAIGAVVGAIAGGVLLRTRVVPLIRGGVTAGLIGYRLVSTLGALSRWIEARRPLPGHPQPAGELDGASAGRQLVIVAATDVPLYRSLRAAFAEREGVDVMLDRRRRPAALPRRLSDRRARRDIEALIQSTGWARLVLPHRPPALGEPAGRAARGA